MAEYRLFAKPNCGICRNVKAQLAAKKIPYTEIDVSTHEGWEEAKRFGVRVAGTILDENNQQVKVSEL